MDSPSKFQIRNARVEDWKEILEIYSPYVINSITSLEFDVPSEMEMKKRITETLRDFPWLVYETEDGSIGGYSYACKHRVRVGYQWACEIAVYVAPKYRKMGIATLLYNELFNILAKQGYFKALAIISGENEGSVQLHMKLGFSSVGHWENVGNKFGKWIDVHWYAKDLQVLIENPPTPIPYSQLRQNTSVTPKSLTVVRQSVP